ncbi:helix-turn-helix transcriptional regulator [Polymorphospora sp. NPDC051019]|uniref:helix-turn-helix transcriptional regulator n=1 Tax=Polymorphospora sp. NPDC051019 TaxID=3155725 RepID=UPI003442B6B7
MPNDRLRDGLLKRGLTPAALAGELGVDPKTVERWITQDRTPYPRYRHAIAALLREGESYLWPSALPAERAAQVSQSEIVHVYPRRGAVPQELWQRLLDGASRHIGILVYAGLFLPEQNPRWVPTLRAKAEAGAQVELLFGDPESQHVAQRGEDEGIGSAMASKVLNTLAFYKDLRGMDTVGIYFHDTILYNSIYRFDDELLVNTHLYGTPAAYAPVLHLRRLGGGELFDNYVSSFNRTISQARAVWPGD